jgi:hypothetical protein
MQKDAAFQTFPEQLGLDVLHLPSAEICERFRGFSKERWH